MIVKNYILKVGMSLQKQMHQKCISLLLFAIALQKKSVLFGQVILYKFIGDLKIHPLAGGDQAEKRKAFDELVKNLKPKIEKLIRLPVATMDTVNLKFKLREIYNND